MNYIKFTEITERTDLDIITTIKLICRYLRRYPSEVFNILIFTIITSFIFLLTYITFSVFLMYKYIYVVPISYIIIKRFSYKYNIEKIFRFKIIYDDYNTLFYFKYKKHKIIYYKHGDIWIKRIRIYQEMKENNKNPFYGNLIYDEMYDTKFEDFMNIEFKSERRKFLIKNLV